MTAAALIDTLPAAWYADPQVFENERRRIFARHWHLLGRTSQLQGAGDYVTGEVAGLPVFAVVGRDGVLRAFHNVCRHRAGPLFTDEGGTCQALRCRYHGWLYGFDGALRSAPGFPDADAPDLETWMGAVGELAAPFPAMSDFVFHGEKTYEGACDWKAYGDNSCEGYHLPFIHGELNKAVASCDIRTYEDGSFVGFHVGYSGGVREAQGLWIYKFPAILLHFGVRSINVEQVEAVAPGRIRIRSLYWVPEGEAAYGDAYRADSDLVIGEDMGVCERVQANLEAGLYQGGKLSPEKEPGTVFFQRLVRDALAQPPVSLDNQA
jgi:choline monooxygenase